MDFGKRVEAGFLDKFTGEVVKAGYIEGLVPAGKSLSGQPVKTQQLFLLWKVLDVEGDVKDQPGWYGMGAKDWSFSGTPEVITVGEKELALYPDIADAAKAPDVTDTSWLGLLSHRCESLGFSPKGTVAAAFLGLKAAVQREKYADVVEAYLQSAGKERRGTPLSGTGDNIMPISVLVQPGVVVTTTTAVTTDEDKALILKAVIGGCSEQDLITKVATMDTVKEAGLKVAEILRIADELSKAGEIGKDEAGKYQVNE